MAFKIFLLLFYRREWDLSLQDSIVLELDSTTKSKFSRHLVIRLPGVAFDHNLSVGRLVHRILDRSRDPLLLLAVDTGVYSRYAQPICRKERFRNYLSAFSCNDGRGHLHIAIP